LRNLAARFTPGRMRIVEGRSARAFLVSFRDAMIWTHEGG